MHWLCPLWQVLGFGFGSSAFEEEDRRKMTQRRRERWKRLSVSVTLESFIVNVLAST